jgi:AraC-like DNA-binding protein
MSTYREYPPSAALREYVDCYWTRTGEIELPAAHRVLPDGCIDIMFDFASNHDDAFVIGPMTRPLLVDAGSPENMIAVRFRPGGAFAFFNLPMHALTNARVEVANFWKDAAAFEDSILERVSIDERIATLECALIARLSFARSIDRRIRAAIKSLRHTSGQMPIDSISSEFGMSRQHLTRKFQEQVGISPKLFARIVRMQDMLRRVENVREVDWCTLALDSGYYDQAHMIDDFRDLCGISPARYLALNCSGGR